MKAWSFTLVGEPGRCSTTAAFEGETERKVGPCFDGEVALYPVGVVFLIGEELEVVVGVVTVALAAKIDLSPTVEVDSIVVVVFTGDADEDTPVADLTGLATNCIGFVALVGLGDRRRDADR